MVIAETESIPSIPKSKTVKVGLMPRPILKQSTLSSKQKENFKIYNEYLESLIPKDEQKNQKYVVLVEKDKYSVSSPTKFNVIKNIAPIPLRFLRQEDYFVILPLKSNNPRIYKCEMTPRAPENVFNQNSGKLQDMKFSVTSKALTDTKLEIPSYMPVNSDNTEVIFE